MANVMFKRGYQSALPTTAVDGVFYLTTDTNRLYVGQGESLKLLNQTVQFKASVSELNSLSAGWDATAKESHKNDFYYITGDNILATWTGSEWKQINPDIHIDSVGIKGTSSTTAGAANLQISATNNKETTVSATMAVLGSNGVSVGVNGNNLTISGDPYTLGAGIDNNDFNIYLSSAGSTTQTASFRVAGGLSLSNTGSHYVLASADNNTTNAGLDLTIPTTGSLAVSIVDSADTSLTATLANVGILLNDGHYVPIASTSGASAGAIYSAAEIDQKLSGLDGMTFKGSIGDGDTLPTTNVSNGDVYVITKAGESASSSMFTGSTFDTVSASMLDGTGDHVTRVGDMVIAKGTETNGKITSGLKWIYIPAGNDSLDAVSYSSTVNAANNEVIIANELGTSLAEIALAAGQNIAISSSTTGSRLVSTISHTTFAAVTPATAATVSDRTATFTAIKGLTLSNGHVTGITTDVFTPVTYDLAGATATATTHAASFSIGLNNSNETQVSTAVFALNSDSINFSATGNNGVVMNIQWGEF